VDRLTELEQRTIYIIREAYALHRRLAMLWSIGKDSTSLLWMARKAFFGRIPFPVLHIDTGFKFPEIYAFRDRYAREWGLDLRVVRNDAALAAGMNPATGKLACCSLLKTEALRQALSRERFDALLLGIRRDEHGIRAKERYFSPRDERFRWDYRRQPTEMWDHFAEGRDEGTHLRIHPLLHWREADIWAYLRRERAPVIPLYFAREGRRYRSIGCAPCCAPVPSTAATLDEIVEELRCTRTSERSGRAQDKESAYAMQRLRSLGYM
jgi:sulfate adenylyltransferase subunit 2